MKIELCEDNGFLNDGTPTLVVLVVTNSEGKQLRMPYEATKTIQELYQDAKKIEFGAVVSPLEIIHPEKKADEKWNEKKENIVDDAVISAVTEIEREDIVKCFRLEKDLDGNTNDELEIGKEYRIINVIKQQGKLICYEVLDDVADNKIRIPIRPDEVQLVKKHFKQPPRVQIMELKKKCENCQEENALPLNEEKNKYEVSCTKCGAWLSEARPTTEGKVIVNV